MSFLTRHGCWKFEQEGISQKCLQWLSLGGRITGDFSCLFICILYSQDFFIINMDYFHNQKSALTTQVMPHKHGHLGEEDF